MRKKIVGISLSVIAALLFALTVVVEAQQRTKIFRVGYLSAFDPARESARAEVLRSALRERGYIEGQNIAIEYRYAEGNQNRFPKLPAIQFGTMSFSIVAIHVLLLTFLMNRYKAAE